MDRTKLALGVVIALLMGALVVSWKQLSQDVRNAPSSELQMQAQMIAQMQADNQRMTEEIALLKSQQQIAMAKAAEPVVPQITPEQQQKELEERQAQLDALKAQEKKVKMGEDGLLAQRDLEKSDSELRRGRLVSQALLIAKIREWINKPEAQFAVLEVISPEQVKVGTDLAIRRGVEIVMTLQVTSVEADGVIASPKPGSGNVAPQAGDELILPPA